ncbi:MAG TPA: MBL fold metallo-hydrolase, partial [Aggregatilineales bacterium]|nr:MBL fold metallo-hydrolase [Aggregatilineales bacterium]
MSQQLPPIERYESNTGIRIYRMPVEAFPGFIAYTCLLLGGEVPTLVDTGSNMDKSQQDLKAAIESVHDDFGESIRIEDIKRILITHGHIDHHGGLNFARELIPAEVGIHPLDRRILTAYEERVIVATKNLRVYLQRAGVSSRSTANLMEMYGFAKRLLKSERVDFLLEESSGEL